MHDRNGITNRASAFNLNQANQDDEQVFDLRAFYLALKRQKWTIISTVIVSLIVAFIVVMQMTPRYRATAMMALETRKNQVVDFQAVMTGMGTDLAAIKTEIDVIKSRRLVGALVTRFELEKDPEFNGDINPQRSLLSNLNPVQYIPDAWKAVISGPAPKPMSPEEKVANEHARTVDSVLGKLEVSHVSRSYSILLTLESRDAQKAARLVNGLAEIYLTDQLETKFEATQRANDWLNERIFSLRNKLRESELAAQKFREENQLIRTDSAGLVQDQQLNQLNIKLIEARTELARVQSRYEQFEGRTIEDMDLNNVAEVLDSALIQRLREQQSQSLRNRAELSTRYGPKHPKMKNVEAELSDIAANIKNEARNIIAGLANEVRVAQTRVNTLEASLNKMKAENFEINRAQVQLRELEREVDANKVLLETFLARFKETTNQADLEQADARIISQAETPLAPSYPRPMLIMGIVGMLSTVLGFGLALLIEMLDNGYRSLEQLRVDMDLRGLGMVPLLHSSDLKDKSVENYLLERPNSSYAEAHRNMHASLLFSGAGNSTPQIVMMTSSVPGEGKSTLALCYARLMAQAGNKVLLLEADMRRPVMKNRLGKDLPQGTLASLLDSDANSASQVIYSDGDTGLQVIVAGSHRDPQSLFVAKRFDGVLEWARANYDIVVIDTPPVMAVSDAVVISHKVDAVIYAVQWENTPKNTVRSGISTLREAGAPLAGVVMSMVDVRRHQNYGYSDHGYYYGKKGDYYTN